MRLISLARKNLKEKLKDARAMGTTLLASGLIIGFGMPMLAAGWDINNMRTYKIDMQNVADVGLLSVQSHAQNKFDKNAKEIVRQVMACNLNVGNMGNGIKQHYANKNNCATYSLDRSNKGGQIIRNGGNREVILKSGKSVISKDKMKEPKYRPGLEVTDFDVNQNSNNDSITGSIRFNYHPMFLGRLVKIANGQDIVPIETKADTVHPKFLDPGDVR